MSKELLASKIVVNEEEPQIRQITGVLTNKLGIVGITEKGPFGDKLITSPAEYRRYYGGYVGAGDVAQAVDGFFLNGGSQCVISRVVHLADVSDPTTKTSAKATKTLQTGSTSPSSGSVTSGNVQPYALAHGQTLVVSVNGGGPTTATFSAVAAQRDSTGSWPLTIADGGTLLVSIDGGAVQTIAFAASEFANNAAATAAEVAASINGKLTGGKATVVGGQVRIKSDRLGTGSGVNVSGGSSNGVLGFTTGNVAGSGNVSNVAAVTAAEVAAVLNGAVAGQTSTSPGGAVKVTSNTTGGASTVQVQAGSTATAIGFDNAIHTGLAGAAVDTYRVDGKYDGAYANALNLKVSNATSAEAARHNLQVLKSGVILETWPNLSMDPNDPRYVETVINDPVTGSAYIEVEDLFAATSAPRPANVTTGVMTGGDDGLASLSDTDFIGGTGPNGRTGMRVFDVVPDLALLAIPGRATAAVQNAMVAYCEVTRDKALFPILGPPANTNATGIVTYMESTAGLLNLSEFGAMYWPRLKVVNPSKTIFGTSSTIIVDPVGYVAGVYARSDQAREGGIYEAPAGIEKPIFGVVGFETDEVLDEDKRDIVYPKRVNPITKAPGLPVHIDGTRTLKESGNFPSVSERRAVIYIEQSIKRGLQFARHKNNDEALRAEVQRTCEGFLTVQMNLRAFRSKDPATAFFVDFDVAGRSINNPAIQFAGKLVGRIGLATQKPTDFVILNFSQDTRAFEQAAAAAA